MTCTELWDAYLAAKAAREADPTPANETAKNVAYSAYLAQCGNEPSGGGPPDPPGID